LLLRTGRPCACRQQRHPISSCAPEARSVCHVCCCSRGCAGGCASATHSAPASFKAPGECSHGMCHTVFRVLPLVRTWGRGCEGRGGKWRCCCGSRGCAGGCASATHSAPAPFKAPGECSHGMCHTVFRVRIWGRGCERRGGGEAALLLLQQGMCWRLYLCNSQCPCALPSSG
jgi:hypothetical protein